jgi:prepilin-type N-terminal cleavage/methylation domain-containing protein
MNRRAVTLPELLLVLVMLGVLTGIGAPRLADAADRAALRTARGQLLRAPDASRGAAIRLGQPVDLVATDGELLVAPSAGGAPVWRVPGPDHLGVTLSGLSIAIRFGPSGIATGVSNRTIRLRKGGDTMQVIVSRLGRVR